MSFGRKVAGTLRTVVGSVMEQMPLFMTDLSSGLRAGFQELANTETAMSRVKAITKATGEVAGFTADEFQRMADELEDATVFGDDQVLGAIANLLQFKNVREDVFEGTLDAVADMAAAIGTDLAGAADKLGRALDDPIRGVKTLRSEGIKFSAAEVDMIEKMTQAGNVMEVQRFMLDRLNATFGGAAEAEAKTFTGQMKQLNNALGDQWKAIANALTPAVQAVIPWIKASAQFTERAAIHFREWVVAIVDWANASGPIIRRWMEQARDWAGKAFTWIVDRATEAFTFVQTAFQEWPALSESAFKTIQVAWETMTQAMHETWAKLANFVTGAFNTMVSGVKKSIDTVLNQLAVMLGPGSVVAKFLGYTTGFSGEKFVKGIRMMQVGISSLSNDFKTGPLVEGPTDEDRARLAKLREEAAAAATEFGGKFGENLEKNKAFVDKMLKNVMEAFGLADTFEAKTSGKTKDQAFVFDKEAKDESKAGGFEDLLALQKRIQGAAIKSPEAQATEQQTFIMQQHHQQQHKQGEELNKLNQEEVELLKGTGKPKFADDDEVIAGG